MTDLKELFKKAVELCMPDLRKFYRVVRKARIEKTYASDGRYYADVQPLRNDESVDSDEPVITGVEIPVIWAGMNRGIICPPATGSYCDLEYYDGDPNYPRISNFRWYKNGAPAAAIDEFIIQQADGVYIRIKANTDIEVKTPGKIYADAGGIVSVHTPAQFFVNAPLSVFTGEVQIDGLLTYMSGLAGSGGGEYSAVIAGKVQVEDVVTENGVSSNSHVHGGVQSGTYKTGAPE